MKGLVVSNTGPVIALSIINKLNIISDLFQSVCVPEQVHREILKGGQVCAGIKSYNKASWINIEYVKTQLDPLLSNILDEGEASVIQIAVENNADYVLIDERKARKIARTVFNLKVVGTAGILIEAKRKGLIKNVGELLIEMKNNGYWIHDDIIKLALDKANEI